MISKFIALGIYVAILFIIGWVASRRIKSMSDFYVGGKNIGFWAVAFSARATGESGWILIGLTGMGALMGLTAYWVVIGEVLGVAISWWFMAKRFKRATDHYGSITIPDYLESRFNATSHKLRVLAASILSVFVIIYVSSQIDATGIAFESMIGIDYYQGALLGFFIVLIYIFMGGFVAVVWSDLFQGLLMFLGLVALPIVAFWSYDSQESIITGLANIDSHLIDFWGGSDDGWLNLFTILGFSMIGLGFLGAPQVYMRFISIKSEKQIDKGKWVAIIFTLLTDAAAVSIGLLARYIFTGPGEDPELVFGTGATDVLNLMVDEFLPYFIVAIYIAIVLSAIMSTIDSLLVMASSAITRDFYQKIFRPDIKDHELTKISRWVTLVMALLALGIAMGIAFLSPDRQVFWVIIFGWSGIAATFCPVMILALFWKGYSEKGAIASMIVGFLAIPFFKFFVQELEGVGKYFERLDVLLPSFLLAMIAGWIFSKIYPPQKIPV
jgi:sodium/proline symporter